MYKTIWHKSAPFDIMLQSLLNIFPAPTDFNINIKGFITFVNVNELTQAPGGALSWEGIDSRKARSGDQLVMSSLHRCYRELWPTCFVSAIFTINSSLNSLTGSEGLQIQLTTKYSRCFLSSRDGCLHLYCRRAKHHKSGVV